MSKSMIEEITGTFVMLYSTLRDQFAKLFIFFVLVAVVFVSSHALRDFGDLYNLYLS
jgi:hypothetical protein